jgi:glutathione S-transferase
MKIYWIKAQAPRRVLALVKHLGIEAELVAIDLKARGLKAPEYVALNPNMKAPTLVDGDLVLWEASAIMAHLCIKAGSDMWPAHNPAEQVEVLRWLSWNDNHWVSAVGPFYFEHVVKATFGLGVETPRSPEVRKSAGWPSRGPRLCGLRQAHHCRLPARLNGKLLARIGDADGGISQHRALD